jgi:hypothetical protein
MKIWLSCKGRRYAGDPKSYMWYINFPKKILLEVTVKGFFLFTLSTVEQE